MVEALGAGIEVAARIGHKLAEHAGRPIDRRWVAEEGIEGGWPGDDLAVLVVDSQNVVDRLHHETVPDTQALVRRLEAELVAI